MNSTDLLRQAYAAIQSGERRQARDLLLQVVEVEPRNERAWIWLSQLVDEPQDRVTALENVLTINPGNTRAAALLEALRIYPQAVTDSPAALVAPAPVAPVAPQLPTRAPAVPEPEPAGRPVAAWPAARPAPTPVEAQLSAGSVTPPPAALPAPLAASQLAEATPGEAGPEAVSTTPARREPARRLYQQAQSACRRGRCTEAVTILQRCVQADPHYQAAWLMLAGLAPKIEDRQAAVEHVLRLNPTNKQALALRSELEKLPQDPLQRGRIYDRQGHLDLAIQAYTDASYIAASALERAEAQRLLRLIQLRTLAPGQKAVDPRLTVLRLTVAQILPYFALLLIQSGFNPLHLSLPLILGMLVIPIGSLIVTVTRLMPDQNHPLGRALAADFEKRAVFLPPEALWLFGLVLLLAPYFTLFVVAFDRLRGG